jgi:hypothetical protein
MESKMADEGLAAIMAGIAKDIREIKDDLRWFREREQGRLKVGQDLAAEGINRLVVSRHQSE